MPADLDQFGRNNSHGTIVGGKGLIKFAHHAAYGGGCLHQVHEVTGVSEIKGGLHTGDAAANDHDGSDSSFRHLRSRIHYVIFSQNTLNFNK
jgi:hypothetical protein